MLKPKRTLGDIVSFLIICAIAFMFWYAAFNGEMP